MKKLASALLALFMLVQPLVDVAHARLLIIEDKKESAGDENDSPDVQNGTRTLRSVVAALLRQYGLRQGTDYDIVSVGRRGMNAARVRLGQVVDKTDDPNSTTTTYDAAVLISYNGFSLSVNSTTFRGDSLRLYQNTTNYNRIPLMFVGFGSGGQNGVSESTGYGTDNTHMGTMGQVMYSTKDHTVRFRTGVSKVASAIGNPAGMERVLIGASIGRSEGTQQDIETDGPDPFPCMWCDSVYTTAPGTGDSAIVWMRYFDHIPGAKPIIYTQSNDYAGTALNIAALWTGLAMLDSLAGGAVFSGATRTPEFGILVPGLASRGAAVGFPTSTGGLVADDTTNTYSAIGDSLATLGVPIAFGAPANLDSITTYKRDIQYVMSKSSRFSLFPFQRYGVDTSDAAIGAGRTATSKYHPIDIFGAWRNRKAIGDGSFAGADTSLGSHIRRAFAVMDSLYPGRVDHALYAPLDDWTPKNFCCIGPESLYSAFAYGGAKAVVTNFRIANAQVGKLTSQQQGARWATARERAPYAFGGTSVNVLAAAPIDSGSARFDNGNGQVGSHEGFDTFKAIDRFWLGFVDGRNHPMNGYGSGLWTADSSSANIRTLVVPVAAFGSGNRADRATLPTRPGWWYTKAIVNATKVINSYGYPGRTYIRVAKVEDVQP